MMYGTMHRKTNKVFAISLRTLVTCLCDDLVKLLVSELVWYLVNEVQEVNKVKKLT